MRVAVLGAGGQLGTDLLASAEGRNVTGIAHSDLDIRDPGAIAAMASEIRPDVIVNAAAYVDVEGAESHEAEAFAVNATAVGNLAAAAERIGARLVHVSTDYVFDGAAHAPYTEDAPPDPINAYGRSKLAGEHIAQDLCRRVLIVRSSGLYGVAATRAKGNFVRTMLRLGRERGEVAVVTDQVLTPTSTADLARVLWEMVDREATGLYHATNAGSCSWFEFARAIFELSGLDVRLTPTVTAALGYRARRPAYSVLSNAKLRRDGFTPLRPWREALAAHLETLAQLT